MIDKDQKVEDKWQCIRELDKIASKSVDEELAIKYESHTVKDLKTICKSRKIKHYSVMNKPEICELLRKNDDDPNVKFNDAAREKSQEKMEKFLQRQESEDDYPFCHTYVDW